ncbi:MAG: replication-associated recombination protein A [Oscillospiraceae bacterium]|nr:replication-associated recombination protein A [Oscillospiraceae bacterium]
MTAPLADRVRPESLDDVVGQRHLLGPDAVLRRMVDSGHITNMIFYGPSGVGKTTVARIIARQTGKTLHKLNGTSAGVADIKQIISGLDTFEAVGGVLLYLDEIQYLNKKQQQSLLEFIENGQITLIASTTENPYFYVYNAILSRSTVFEFQPVNAADIEQAVLRAFKIMEKELGTLLDLEEGVVEAIALGCGGDVRKSINAVEMCALSAPVKEGRRSIGLEEVRQVSQRSAMRYDRDGDAHYDILSAFHKSVRGSDENAALHYLARLLSAGDILSPCRRLLCIACEDIGLAWPQAIPIVKACVDSALQLGLPEARLPLADATILLCTAPKSNAGAMAIDAAMADVRAGKTGDIPAYLKDSHYSGAKKLGRGLTYRYPHPFPGHYYPQQYLPDELKGRVYYQFQDNKTEQAAAAYRRQILALWEKDKPDGKEKD